MTALAAAQCQPIGRLEPAAASAAGLRAAAGTAASGGGAGRCGRAPRHPARPAATAAHRGSSTPRALCEAHLMPALPCQRPKVVSSAPHGLWAFLLPGGPSQLTLVSAAPQELYRCPRALLGTSGLWQHLLPQGSWSPRLSNDVPVWPSRLSPGTRLSPDTVRLSMALGSQPASSRPS